MCLLMSVGFKDRLWGMERFVHMFHKIKHLKKLICVFFVMLVCCSCNPATLYTEFDEDLLAILSAQYGITVPESATFISAANYRVARDPTFTTTFDVPQDDLVGMLNYKRWDKKTIEWLSSRTEKEKSYITEQIDVDWIFRYKHSKPQLKIEIQEHDAYRIILSHCY